MTNSTDKFPALFLGHGSPMNVLEENAFTQSWEQLATTLPQPRAILCISAHWETHGTRVGSMEHPNTIYDFSGFPKPLYEITYPAPGDPQLAHNIQTLVGDERVQLDDQWGLDHGSWAVLIRMYPKADIPVLQLSLDRKLQPREHYDLGRKLKPLREQGVLVLGSGNIVHNLGRMDPTPNTPAYDWAVEFDEKIKTFLKSRDHESLIDYTSLGEIARLSAPTPEHYLPLLYIAALQDDRDTVTFPIEGMDLRSVSMRGVLIA